VARSTVTTAEGIYNLPYLTPGTYKIEISAAGFKKVVRDSVDLNVSSTVRVDVQLEPGAVNEVVNVTAEAPPLQTDRAEVARNFTTQNVTELPLANRSFQALAGLVAGVTPPTVDFTQSEDPQGTTFFRANGQGNSANNTLVDGVDNTNPTLGLTVYIPPAEVVQEVHVSTSNYNAEFGRPAVRSLTLQLEAAPTNCTVRYTSSIGVPISVRATSSISRDVRSPLTSATNSAQLSADQ